MAKDLIKILRELRGTGQPEAEYTDGIYWDLTINPTDTDGTARAGAGMYPSMVVLHNSVKDLVPIKDELMVLEQMHEELHSLYTDKATLDSIYADKATLDSLFNDKVTLDSLFSDKTTLDSLFADKATLDSIYADKSKLDSLYADKATLDSLYSDKATLDSLFNDKGTLDSLYADKAKLDSLYADKSTLDRLHDSIDKIDRVFTSIDNLDRVFGSITNVDTIADNVDAVNYFAQRYLGQKTEEPTTRNDGSDLVSGDLYFDISDDDPQYHAMKVYNVDEWYIGYADDSVVLHKVNNLNDLTDTKEARANIGIGHLDDADEFLATLNITDIAYNDAGDPDTITYEGDGNKETIEYSEDGPTKIRHYIGDEEIGNTDITYTDGNPVTSEYAAL